MKFYHLNAPGPYYTNSFLIISEAGRGVVIDACAAPEKYLELLDREHASLAAILQTHGHFDHVGSIPALKKATGARVYLNKNDAALFGLKADESLEDGQTVQVDELAFSVITTPGHTPGSVCLQMGDRLFSGDTLFAGDIGRTDLEGGSYTEIQRSLHKLLDRVQGDPQVLPGHEEFSTFSAEKAYNRYLR